ncbi:hypothetical protein CCH79_00010784 [Gambusia affinis]|uniref:Homeobox domain-containing protein n=1 Tax=Gambusia affinis TaxID=33528 RepID=A0A315VK55_GAMAF|nr:hypothetical protein CCH79_00010784 [Gambusia affinis]
MHPHTQTKTYSSLLFSPNASPLYIFQKKSSSPVISMQLRLTYEEKYEASFGCFCFSHREPCKRKEQEQSKLERNQGPKRTRLVFTDLQRRTLMAIFRENHRPTKELQVTISQQLGLELSTVSNFFMNARRRNLNKWADEGRPSSTGSSGSSVSSSAVSCSTA